MTLDSVSGIFLSAISNMFDYDATDISRAYAAARTPTEGPRERTVSVSLARGLA
jgi:hypothetical protein